MMDKPELFSICCTDVTQFDDGEYAKLPQSCSTICNHQAPLSMGFSRQE